MAIHVRHITTLTSVAPAPWLQTTVSAFNLSQPLLYTGVILFAKLRVYGGVAPAAVVSPGTAWDHHDGRVRSGGGPHGTNSFRYRLPLTSHSLPSDFRPLQTRPSDLRMVSLRLARRARCGLEEIRGALPH